MAKTLLIIEDEALLGAEMKRHFERVGWKVVLVNTIEDARTELLQNGLLPPVVLSDMNLPDGNALDLLEEINSHKLDGEWIILTGYGSVADSVRAVRLGAYDFLEKPVDFERLDLVINGAARSATAQRRLYDQIAVGHGRFTPESFVGKSQAAEQLRVLLKKLASAPVSALIITGETGTGKGVAARILHNSGARNNDPMVEVNCSALPKDLLESELFGHEAGSFTGAKGKRRGLFEQADGGTLFLDEIGEMPADLQAKLLKVLEEQCFRRVGGDREITVDVQVIAATNRDLAACVEEGTFREDLYHRLSVFELQLPPLRSRIEDLDQLVPLFISEFNSKAGKNVSVVCDEAWGLLKSHKWPGNVRELRNVTERCVLFAENEELPLQWLQLQPLDEEMMHNRRSEDKRTPARRSDDNPVEPTRTAESGQQHVRLPLDGSMGLDEMDRFIIQTALEQNQFNITATARTLNTTRDTLRYRIRKYEIPLPEDA